MIRDEIKACIRNDDYHLIPVFACLYPLEWLGRLVAAVIDARRNDRE